MILDKNVVTNDIRDIFKSLGCSSEKAKEGYFVLEIPADKDYAPVRERLNALEDKGTIAYAEPCLSDKHRY